MTIDTTIAAKNQQLDGGDRWEIGGSLNIDTTAGGSLTVDGSEVLGSGSLATVGGEAALDGANPTAVATGLTTITSFVATLKGTAAPGVSTSVLTASVSAGTASVYAWKPTSATDPTLIASTGTDSFYWVAVGTK